MDQDTSRLIGLLQQAIQDPALGTTQRMQLSAALSDLNAPPAPPSSQRAAGSNVMANALVVPVAIGGITVSIAAILTILCVITAAILLYLLWDRYADQIQATLIAMSRALAQEFIQLRRRVEQAHRDLPNNSCDPQLAALVAAINQVVMALNTAGFSRGLTRANIRGLQPKLQAVAVAMQAYLACIGTSAAAELLDTFLGGGGRLTRMLRQMLEALRGPNV